MALYSELISVGYACLVALIKQLLHCDSIKTASIVFIHTHGRNRSYNSHYHMLLAEGRLNQRTTQ